MVFDNISYFLYNKVKISIRKKAESLLATIFLTKKEQKKLALFYHLERLPAGEYTVKSISDELGYVYSTTQVLLNEIAADCSTINQAAVLFTPQKQVSCPLSEVSYD